MVPISLTVNKTLAPDFRTKRAFQTQEYDIASIFHVGNQNLGKGSPGNLPLYVFFFFFWKTAVMPRNLFLIHYLRCALSDDHSGRLRIQ